MRSLLRRLMFWRPNGRRLCRHLFSRMDVYSEDGAMVCIRCRQSFGVNWVMLSGLVDDDQLIDDA